MNPQGALNSAIHFWCPLLTSIPNSEPALPKYKCKDILQNQLLDIQTQENTYVAVHTLVEIFSTYYI